MIHIDATHPMYQTARRVSQITDKRRTKRWKPTWGFTSDDVVLKCDVTLRQLQWWDEQNVVRPQMEGHHRVYSPQQVQQIQVIKALRNKGISLQRVRRFLAQIADAKPGQVAVWKTGVRYRLTIHASTEAAIREALEAPGAVIVVRIP